jgi:hypothetical protein
MEPQRSRKETDMTKEKFEPAKVIGTVDLKKDDKGSGPDENSIMKTQASEENNPMLSEAAANAASSPQNSPEPEKEIVPSAEQAEESMTDLLHRNAEQDRADIAAAATTAKLQADSSTLPANRPTVKEMVDEVKRIIVVFVAMGLEAIGAYLLANVFDGNFKKALSKDPYKGTSLNDLARHKEMPLSRQRLAECIRSAGVGAELESLGLHLDRLTFYHKVEISRIKSPELRVQVALETQEKELTVSEVREKVKKLTGKTISADKRMVKSLIRQLGDVARLTVDDDTLEFLVDKDRLKEALDRGETAQLLDSSEKFRKASAQSRAVLQQLETTLEDIVLERRQDEEETPGEAKNERG